MYKDGYFRLDRGWTLVSCGILIYMYTNRLLHMYTNRLLHLYISSPPLHLCVLFPILLKQIYVIKYVSHLWYVCCLLMMVLFPPLLKLAVEWNTWDPLSIWFSWLQLCPLGKNVNQIFFVWPFKQSVTVGSINKIGDWKPSGACLYSIIYSLIPYL